MHQTCMYIKPTEALVPSFCNDLTITLILLLLQQVSVRSRALAPSLFLSPRQPGGRGVCGGWLRLGAKKFPVEPLRVIARDKHDALFKDDELEENFVRGSGPGGQSINKSRNRVQLTHLPTGISVSCQDFRDLTSNRKHARTLLRQKVDLSLHGADSKLGRKQERARRRKYNAARRAKKKYGDKTQGGAESANHDDAAEDEITGPSGGGRTVGDDESDSGSEDGYYSEEEGAESGPDDDEKKPGEGISGRA